MREEKDILEKNISRLVKSGKDGYILVDNFAERLKVEALRELTKQLANDEKPLQLSSDAIVNGVTRT